MPRLKTASRLILAAAAATLLPFTITAAQATTTESLAWPESLQPIPNGSQVMVWESIPVGKGLIPCQAQANATVLVNGATTDRVSAEDAEWSECGSLVVTGGFTTVRLNVNELAATAKPAINVTEPTGCKYRVTQATGHRSAKRGAQRYASYKATGEGTLIKGGTRCKHAITVKFVQIAIAGPQSGGFGLVPWVG